MREKIIIVDEKGQHPVLQRGWRGRIRADKTGLYPKTLSGPFLERKATARTQFVLCAVYTPGKDGKLGEAKFHWLRRWSWLVREICREFEWSGRFGPQNSRMHMVVKMTLGGWRKTTTSLRKKGYSVQRVRKFNRFSR